MTFLLIFCIIYETDRRKDKRRLNIFTFEVTVTLYSLVLSAGALIGCAYGYSYYERKRITIELLRALEDAGVISIIPDEDDLP